MIGRWATSVSRLRGWRRVLTAVVVGAASVLSLAPFHAWPILFITVPILVWLLDGCSRSIGADSAITTNPLRRRLSSGAFVGWCFGFGYFLAGLHWVGAAFLVEAERFAWLLPVVVSVLPAGLALFFAAGAALAALLWRPGIARCFGLALGLGLSEWLRGHVLTGFPWNTIGYSLTSGEALMQWASVFGVYGLSLLALVIFASPAVVWSDDSMQPAGRADRFGYPIVMSALLLGGLVWGSQRLARPVALIDGVRLRIVQPNIPQAAKWKPENRNRVFREYLDLSRRNAGARIDSLSGVTHLIWPESALPFLLEETGEALSAIADMLPPRTILLTGAARAEDVRGTDGGTGQSRIYNSILALDDRSRILARYDKRRLVPFGEYLPFQEALEAIGLEQLTRVRGGFTAGRMPRLLEVPGVPPFAPLICYEIIFPGAVRQAGTTPRWLLNVTNDAWFGATIGPYQHFHQARVRAVEQGLAVVRAANTGISAVIDPHGRLLAQLLLGRTGVIDSPLPSSNNSTVYARYGISIEISMFILLLAAWLVVSRKSR